jgi:hypothetical protein
VQKRQYFRQFFAKMFKKSEHVPASFGAHLVIAADEVVEQAVAIAERAAGPALVHRLQILSAVLMGKK